MNLAITRNTLNRAIILTGIYIPAELFDHIVDHLSTQDLWKSGPDTRPPGTSISRESLDKHFATHDSRKGARHVDRVDRAAFDGT